jgi:hypothetical protein
MCTVHLLTTSHPNPNQQQQPTMTISSSRRRPGEERLDYGYTGRILLFDIIKEVWKWEQQLLLRRLVVYYSHRST